MTNSCGSPSPKPNRCPLVRMSAFGGKADIAWTMTTEGPPRAAQLFVRTNFSIRSEATSSRFDRRGYESHRTTD